MWWRSILVALAFWLIGAHFLRFDDIWLCVAAALMPALLLFSNLAVYRVMQLALVIGAVGVWGVSGYDYVQMRIAMDAPWLRLAAIMSAVALFTFAAAWWVEGIARLRKLSR
ncbi:hypothetical protein [Shewanella sp. GXUN23E]|uniref:hypothetical protein n=1 Tax=Shewanella sp. GXUN23E TaxID=3422498 RepID=UPI003D7E729C